MAPFKTIEVTTSDSGEYEFSDAEFEMERLDIWDDNLKKWIKIADGQGSESYFNPDHVMAIECYPYPVEAEAAELEPSSVPTGTQDGP